MPTTIQIDEKTRKALSTLKEELKAKSYQEVIEALMSSKRGIQKSLFGFAKGSRHYTHDREEEHAL